MSKYSYAEALQDMQKQRRHVQFYEGQVQRLTAEISALETKGRRSKSDLADLVQLRKMLSLAEKAALVHKRIINLHEKNFKLWATRIDLNRKIDTLTEEE